MQRFLRLSNVLKFSAIVELKNQIVCLKSISLLKELRVLTENLRKMSTNPDKSDELNGFSESKNPSGHSLPSSSSAKAATTSNQSDCSNSGNLCNIIKFLELVGNLKHMKRTGWVLRDINECETIAGHMYRMSVMTFLLNENQDGLDRIKCMELALVHDLAECLVGDITPYCGISREEKKLREENAMREIVSLVEPNGHRMLELFEEYEKGETPEAKFVKDLDCLDMMLQAFEYEKRDGCINKHQEFFNSTQGKFRHPLVKNIVKEIITQRQKLALETQADDDDDDDDAAAGNCKEKKATSS